MTFINEAPDHDFAQFSGEYLVTNCRPIRNYYPWVYAEIADRTGTLHVCTLDDTLLNHTACWTKISGVIEINRNRYGHRRHVLSSYSVLGDELNMTLIPHSQCSHPQSLMTLHQIINDVVSHQPFLHFLNKVFSSQQFTAAFLDASASRNCHHTERGGLFRHSVDVMQHVTWATQNAYSDIERQAVILAALLHDIGKIACILYPKGVFWSQDHRQLNVLVLENALHSLASECSVSWQLLHYLFMVIEGRMRADRLPLAHVLTGADRMSAGQSARALASPDPHNAGRLKVPARHQYPARYFLPQLNQKEEIQHRTE